MGERLTLTDVVLRFLFGVIVAFVGFAGAASFELLPPRWLVIAAPLACGVLAVPFSEPLVRRVLDSPLWLFGRRRF